MNTEQLKKKINKLQKLLDRYVMEDEDKSEAIFLEIEKLKKQVFMLSVERINDGT